MQVNRLNNRIKSVSVRVFAPGNKKSVRHDYRAPKGQVFTEQGVTNALMNAANVVEETHPDLDFEMVQVGPAAYNFVHRGRKASA